MSYVKAYKEFMVEFEYQTPNYFVVIYKPDGQEWCKYMASNDGFGWVRAKELIDSPSGRAIIDAMNVYKQHNIQVGDIVTYKEEYELYSSPISGVTRRMELKLGVVESIDGEEYYVAQLEKDKFYRKTNVKAHLKDKLSILTDRAKWVEIRRDLDRNNDTALLNWMSGK